MDIQKIALASDEAVDALIGRVLKVRPRNRSVCLLKPALSLVIPNFLGTRLHV